VYSGDIFPKEYWGNVFTGEVNGNLVHRDVLKADGVSFSASRAKDGVEFLASTDAWFRPCNLANAPDGNLYVTDIYRLFIETPESIPEELKKNMDFWAGDTMGRIYRIVPNKPLRQRDLKPALGEATIPQLVQLLESANGWHRQTAQRLLLERQDASTVPLLTKVAQDSSFPQARLHALWTLEGISGLDTALVLKALKDPDSHIREHALRLAEPFLEASESLKSTVFGMTRDQEPRVQFQLAMTLGNSKDRRALTALVALMSQRATDPWFRTAILSSVAESASEFFERLRAKRPSLDNPELLTQLGSLIGGKHDAGEVSRFLKALATQSNPHAGLQGLARGLKLAGVKNLPVPGAESSLSVFLKNQSDPVQAAAWQAARHLELRSLMKKALTEAQSEDLPMAQRVFAVRALQGGNFATAGPVLERVLNSPSTPALKIAAVEALAAFEDPGIPKTLLSPWKSYSPDVREKVQAVLVSQREWMVVLLKALEDGTVERASIDITVQARLLDHPDPTVAQRARKYFSAQTDDRTKIVEAHRDVLQVPGDVARGKQAFEKTCAKCHMPQRQRARLGPDLSGISSKTKQELLTAILNPSASIEPRFVNYIVMTKDGRMFDGILANETPGAVTLRGTSDEGDITLLRRNIGEIRASTISLMPEELEKTLNHQALADVIAYLQGGL
ncbi:MAG TPA: HEAT repeat domain-containing protein, partial [Terriglobia bacterium]|nr:HEAT repeat domain-containing protein [Terriglobia bacterium]